jgi:hypothetical protein
VIACLSSAVPIAVNADEPEALVAGARIRVTRRADASGERTRMTGDLLADDADTLTIDSGRRGVVRIPRSAVEALEVSRGANHRKGALIGGAAGVTAAVLFVASGDADVG